jgi:serine protease Do
MTQKILQALSSEMGSAVTRARASVVRVSNGPGGAGSGVVWSSEGLILTNAHVVHRRTPTVTLPDGRELPAAVRAHDSARDLALLAVKASGLRAMPLGDSEHLRPGTLVFAVGHPWGVTNAVTAGVIIGVGADMPEMAAGQCEWLMVDLVLRPGNSGGPLVDAEGRMLGVNTIMTGPEVGGAVPVHVVRQFLREATLS